MSIWGICYGIGFEQQVCPELGIDGVLAGGAPLARLVCAAFVCVEFVLMIVLCGMVVHRMRVRSVVKREEKVELEKLEW